MECPTFINLEASGRMRGISLASAFLATLRVSPHAQFNMWPAGSRTPNISKQVYDAPCIVTQEPAYTPLASALGFSVDCLNAMYVCPSFSCASIMLLLEMLPWPVIQISSAWLAKSITTIRNKTISLISIPYLVLRRAVIGWKAFIRLATVNTLPLIARWCSLIWWLVATPRILASLVLSTCMSVSTNVQLNSQANLLLPSSTIRHWFPTQVQLPRQFQQVKRQQLQQLQILGLGMGLSLNRTIPHSNNVSWRLKSGWELMLDHLITVQTLIVASVLTLIQHAVLQVISFSLFIFQIPLTRRPRQIYTTRPS